MLTGKKLIKNVLIKMIIKSLICCNKGGDYISLFIFSLFIAFSYAQLSGINELIHLNLNDINQNPKKSYIKFFNTSDIFFIDKNDSTEIYRQTSTIETNHFYQNMTITNQLINTFNICKAKHELSFIEFKKNFNVLKSNLSFNNNLIRPNIFIQIHDNKNISHGMGFNFHRSTWQTFFNYSSYQYTYNLKLKYDDFIYSKKFLRYEELYETDFYYKKPRFLVSLNMKYFNYWINKNPINGINQDIREDSYKKYILHNLINLYLSHYKKITLSGYFSNNQQEIDLINDGIAIIKINFLETKNQKLNLNYSINKIRHQINFGLIHKKISINMSSRLRTSLISQNLETSIGAPIANNYSNGSIKTNALFFSVNKKISHFFSYTYNVILTKDFYDITSKNNLINIFVDPEVQIENLEYKNKTAMELGLEINYNIKKINFGFSFSQHIPIKIKKISEASIENQNSISSNAQYGGGYLQFLIIKNF